MEVTADCRSRPFLSIVIPVRNMWHYLEGCLQSLRESYRPPDYEVVVVDDGSSLDPPAEVSHWISPFPLRLIRQIPLGVSAARNRGIAVSEGEVLLFVDSDCVLDRHCLASVAQAVQMYPEDIAFQLRLTGNMINHVGMLEHMRVSAVQRSQLDDEGHITYVNTAGFAVRRSLINRQDFFDVGMVRGEDSLVLMRLVRDKTLPRYIPDAVVQHCPPCSLKTYLVKHFWIGYHTGDARVQLRRLPAILMNSPRRWRTLGNLREMAKNYRWGRLSLAMVMLAYIIEVCGRRAHRVCRLTRGRVELLSTAVDAVTEQELQARIVSWAQQRRAALITYLTAWTLVQADRDPDFRDLLSDFTVCYADGMGVVLALLCTRLRITRKVTANEFFPSLCREMSHRRLRIALIGGKVGVAPAVASRVSEWGPSVDICVCHSGYFDSGEEERIIDQLVQARPHIVFLAMGQPTQERCARRWQQTLPNSVLYCVGGLFDVISGRVASPPKLVRRCGFEWLWRLAHSPGLLWRRYILGIPLLGIHVLRAMSKQWAAVIRAIGAALLVGFTRAERFRQ